MEVIRALLHLANKKKKKKKETGRRVRKILPRSLKIMYKYH